MMFQYPNMPWAPSTSEETFGAAAIRALGSLNKANESDPTDIVKAMTLAREHGLEDVVDTLKDVLAKRVAKPVESRMTGASCSHDAKDEV